MVPDKFLDCAPVHIVSVWESVYSIPNVLVSSDSTYWECGFLISPPILLLMVDVIGLCFLIIDPKQEEAGELSTSYPLLLVRSYKNLTRF